MSLKKSQINIVKVFKIILDLIAQVCLNNINLIIIILIKDLFMIIIKFRIKIWFLKEKKNLKKKVITMFMVILKLKFNKISLILNRVKVDKEQEKKELLLKE